MCYRNKPEKRYVFQRPRADKGGIDLYQSATDLIVRTGNFKRNIPLPNILRNYTVSGAKFEDEKLHIHFTP